LGRKEGAKRELGRHIFKGNKRLSVSPVYPDKPGGCSNGQALGHWSSSSLSLSPTPLFFQILSIELLSLSLSLSFPPLLSNTIQKPPNSRPLLSLSLSPLFTVHSPNSKQLLSLSLQIFKTLLSHHPHSFPQIFTNLIQWYVITLINYSPKFRETFPKL